MPDLFTHFALAYLPARATEPAASPPWRLWPTAALFCLGAILPDLVSRGPGFLGVNHYVTGALHSPAVLLLVVYLLSLLFQARVRRLVFVSLASGVGLHLLLDLLQRHIAGGDYYWFFPFSWRSFALGLFWPSDSVLAIPALVLIILLWEMACWLRRRHAAQPSEKARR